MKLIIAEKPMLARDIARSVCGVPVSETTRLPISGNGYTVTSCVGHLLRLKEPEEINPKWKWTSEFSIDQLPISVDNWELVPSNDKKQIISDIGKLLKDCEYVIHAGDPDDEGQLIIDELLEYQGYKGIVKRVLVNDNIDKNIVKAFENLEDNSKYYNLGRAAYARQMADFCFGINESRLAGIRLRRSVAVGRVQTPTLGLVVKRDEAIETHSKRKFYEMFVLCDINDNKQIPFKLKPSEELLSGEDRIYDQLELENVATALIDTDVSVNTKVSKKLNHPPLPYNLTILQSDMNKRYGYGAQETLEITQVLRDKYKAITYNRSDCQYLKMEHHKSAKGIVKCISKNLKSEWSLDYSLTSKAFNDEAVTAHHGIIPQECVFVTDEMSDAERNVYKAISERYVMQFLAPEKCEVSESIISTDFGNCIYKTIRVISSGYKAIFGSNYEDEDDSDNQDDSYIWIEAGDYASCISRSQIDEKETSPPKPYTQGTLITDMASIAKHVTDSEVKEILRRKDDGKKGEHGGIGTVATRSDIIKKLIDKEFIEEKGKKIIATEKGRLFYNMLPEEIRTADTTACWWLIQEAIAEGKEDVNAIQHSVIEVFNRHKKTAYADAVLENKVTVIGKCPNCGDDVIERKGTWSCSSNKFQKNDDGSWDLIAGCGFKILKTLLGKTIPPGAIKQLLEGGRTKTPVKGFTSKRTGNKFNAVLSIDKKTGQTKLHF